MHIREAQDLNTGLEHFSNPNNACNCDMLSGFGDRSKMTSRNFPLPVTYSPFLRDVSRDTWGEIHKIYFRSFIF